MLGLRKCPWNAAVNRRRCLGKTYEQMYGKKKAAQLVKRLRHTSAFSKAARMAHQIKTGRSWAQQFGEERANEIKRRLSTSLILHRLSGAMA